MVNFLRMLSVVTLLAAPTAFADHKPGHKGHECNCKSEECKDKCEKGDHKDCDCHKKCDCEKGDCDKGKCKHDHKKAGKEEKKSDDKGAAAATGGETKH